MEIVSGNQELAPASGGEPRVPKVLKTYKCQGTVQGARLLIPKNEKASEVIEVAFLAKDQSGEPTLIYWNGWLSAKARKFTMTTLKEELACNNKFDEINDEGVFTNDEFLTNEEVSLTIEVLAYPKPMKEGEPYSEEYGEKFSRVKYINGKSNKYINIASADEALGHVKRLGLIEAFNALGGGVAEAEEVPPF